MSLGFINQVAPKIIDYFILSKVDWIHILLLDLHVRFSVVGTSHRILVVHLILNFFST